MVIRTTRSAALSGLAVPNSSPATVGWYRASISSGGKIRFGPVRRDVNVYLKWAFVEAANSSLLNAERCDYGHISRLYQRIKPRRGHGKAKVAVARHLSEASFWMLKKGEPYREPMPSTQR